MLFFASFAEFFASFAVMIFSPFQIFIKPRGV